jgi:hypothetical protein
MRHLILLLAVGLALSANAETTELACRTENGGEFHLLINFDANTVTRTWMYGNEAHKETRDANITESQVNWQYYDSDDVEVTNTLSRDTGNMYTSTRPTTKTPRGILAGGTHSVCNKAAKAF